jgi:hypothetical protein
MSIPQLQTTLLADGAFCAATGSALALFRTQMHKQLVSVEMIGKYRATSVLGVFGIALAAYGVDLLLISQKK